METAKTHLQAMDTSTEVSHQEKTFLVCGAKKFPIHAEFASKYSLFFRFQKNQTLSEITQPVNLLIQNNADSVELGPCRVFSGTQLNGYAGRLVFTENVYDIQSLLSDKKIVSLQSALNDLSLFLNRKRNISQHFRDYTSDLTYDLNVYRKLFDNLDRQFQDEPVEVKETIQKGLLNNEGQNFIRFLNKKLSELSDIISNFSSEEHQRHGFYFRQQVWGFIRCSAFMTRTNLKPRGYAGDFEMMKMVYANEYQGNTTFEKLMHKFAVDQPGATSVRNRKEIIVKMINKTSQYMRLAENQKLRVLSIACGPVAELRDILNSPHSIAKYQFTLLDQDELALEEASRVVEEMCNKTGATADTSLVQASVRLLIANKAFKKNIGQFHFIYSLGLFDYLSPRVGKVVIENLYQILKPGGRMIIGNFHVSNQSKHFLDYWLDWNLNHRTEEEMLMLSKALTSPEVSIFFENTGNQMFLEIIKPKSE